MRTSKCALGLWNLNENRDETSDDVQEFAVGQNFIRKYNMTMKFSKRKDGTNNVSLDVFLGKADQEQTVTTMAYWMILTGFAILAYVGWFSVLKFRRVKQEKAQFS